MIFIYHLTLTFFLYLKIRAMSLNTAGTTPAAISTTSQRLRKENPRKRPSVPPVIQGLNIFLSTVKCVLTKLCHQRFQCVDQLLLLHEQVGGRVPHNELRHLLLFLREGTQVLSCNHFTYILQLLRPIGIYIRRTSKVESNRSCWTLQAKSNT